LNELALFAGAGGGILGGQLLGWRTVCAVEWEPYPASVLCARQNEGLLPNFPIWDDVQTFDGKPWRGIVDVISGGFPCQDISCAGKGAGIDGERSGMWKEFARIISEVQPKYVFVENSPMLTSRGLGTVLGDLASMGFDAEWGVLSAADVGANHKRERIWILAYSSNGEHTDSVRGVNAEAIRVPQENWTERSGCGMSSGTSGVVGNGRASRVCNERSVAHPDSARCEGLRNSPKRGTKEISVPSFQSWWAIEPNVGRVADGVAARVDRLKAIGNGQVPLCAATAFKLLRERLK
jgi:DNA (cytosine-5)-methyltransferase 1